MVGSGVGILVEAGTLPVLNVRVSLMIRRDDGKNGGDMVLDTVRKRREIATDTRRDCILLRAPYLPSFRNLVKTDMLDLNDTN